MSELFKVKQECENYLINIMQVDAEISNTYTMFFSSTADGINRSELLEKYKRLIKRRGELDEDVAVIQDYFSHIIADIENNKTSWIDRMKYRKQIKKMKEKIKYELKVVPDETEVMIHSDTPAVEKAIENAMKSGGEKQGGKLEVK
jgi:flagellar biosynthesis chaperone FliJ